MVCKEGAVQLGSHSQLCQCCSDKQHCKTLSAKYCTSSNVYLLSNFTIFIGDPISVKYK